MWGRRLAVIASGAVLAVGISACGAGSQGSAATPSAAANATPSAAADATPNPVASQEITGAFTRFFDGNTPVDTRISLLQNGQRYAQILQAESRIPNAKATSAEVSNVRVNGQQATVTYTVLVNGNPVLQNQTGTAVLEDGQWKVGDQSFCQLLPALRLPAQQCSNLSAGSATATPSQ